MNYDIFAGLDRSGSNVAQRDSGWEQWNDKTDYEVMSYDIVCACAHADFSEFSEFWSRQRNLPAVCPVALTYTFKKKKTLRLFYPLIHALPISTRMINSLLIWDCTNT